MFIESPTTTINKGEKEVFEFITDLKNFQQLMPENISKFEVLNEDRFLFALTGMPEIVLERKGQTEFSQLVLGAANEKLPFTLTVDIKNLEEKKSEAILSFTGEFNAMMGMMIKSPITNFMATLSENLGKI